MKKRFFISLSILSLSLIFFALVFSVAGATPAGAQGMISAPSEEDDASEVELGSLGEMTSQEISTVQRLLRRLGYLTDDKLSRALDGPTAGAIVAHLKDVNTSPSGMTTEKLMRSLFTAAWIKEGWGTGSAEGQDLVVDKAEVRVAQDALQKLNYAPGPVDGVFGPATYSAIELFQEDNGLNITGLLSRNDYQNITRALNFIDKKPAGIVHMLNWPDYMNPDTLSNFEKETNIRVLHDVFESSSETKELLLNGSDRYDLMVQIGAQMRQVLEGQNTVEALDHAKLPNAKNLDPAALTYTGVLDPDNKHSVPYMWGTVGLGVNKEKVRQVKPDAPLNSLALILDPAIAADVSKCGIAVIDEPNDVVPAFVAYVGGDIKNIGITDLEAVDAVLAKVSQYIKVVSTDSYINSLSDGKYCVAWGYSGDIFFARDMAKEKKTGTIVYNVPKEGSQLWFDLLVMPSRAQNKDGAYQLLNYLMKPEVAAANTNFLQYANPVLASAPFIEPELLKDPGLYPPKSVLKRLTIQPPMPVDIEAEMKRIWSKLSKE
ncbi:MAG TPA: extracellular solute-binding protein [Aestuariivirga sp.]|nr:extracellular solute-binding protein [Aestuariivirga sp.]